MPMTSVSNSTLRTETLARPPTQTPETPNRPLLRNISTVNASAQTRVVEENLSWVADLMLNGIHTLKEVIKADKPIDEKIPDYIASGRKIRLAAMALEGVCIQAANETQAERGKGPYLSQRAKDTQAMFQWMLEQGLPKILDD